MRKKIYFLLATFVLALIFAGCFAQNRINEKNVSIDESVKTVTGVYQGLADNNFFEVKIDGISDDEEFKVFMMTDKIRSKIQGLSLYKGDRVTVKYIINENMQNEVIDLNKN